MKYLISFLLLLYPVLICGQKTYLNKDKLIISDSVDATYFKEMHPGKNENSYIEKIFHISGEKESEITYLKNAFTDTYLLEGKSYSWYKSGQIKSIVEFSEGKFHGSILTYWPNSKLKRKDFYRSGQFIGGACYDSLGNKVKYYDYYVYPMYPGGDAEINKTIIENFKIPQSLTNYVIEGIVEINFAIDAEGNISDLRIISGLHREIDNEILQLFKSLHKFRPGKIDGEISKIFVTFPFTVKINKNSP
jgi:protein TonB